jgi:hypothetical protein
MPCASAESAHSAVGAPAAGREGAHGAEPVPATAPAGRTGLGGQPPLGPEVRLAGLETGANARSPLHGRRVGKPAGANALVVFVLPTGVSADALIAELLLHERPVTFLRAVFPLFSSAGSTGQRVFGLIVLVVGPVMVRVAHVVHICSSFGGPGSGPTASMLGGISDTSEPPRRDSRLTRSRPMLGSADDSLEPHHRSIQMPSPVIGGALLCNATRAVRARPRHPVFRDDDGVDARTAITTFKPHRASPTFSARGLPISDRRPLPVLPPPTKAAVSVHRLLSANTAKFCA